MMPKTVKAKKIKFKRFKKPTFAPKQTADVVTLSDSESDSEDSDDHLEVEVIEEPTEIINISESSSSEDENASIEVVTLDDSEVSCDKKCTDFCAHVETPDYIPIKTSNKNKFRAKTRLKRTRFSLNVVSDVQVTNVGKRKILKAQRHQVKQIRTIKLSHTNVGSVEKKTNTGLRPVVIDGSNVAFAYGTGEFKVRGLIEVIRYFLNRGHEEIVCFLPAHYRNKCRTPDEDKILHAYEKDGILAYTPSRALYGRLITPYDDRFIVQYASEKGGVIISNDGYRDLLTEEESWKETIESRVINYTFVRGLFMLPRDPLGPSGPSLDEMLRFP